MSLRAIGSLLTPRAAAVQGSAILYSRRGAAAVAVDAALAAAGGGTLAAQYFNKRTDDDESAAARKKEEEDMKARFEDWVKKYNKTYPDEEEKARRFQVFKASAEFMDAHNLSVHNRVFPEMNYFADFTRQERRRMCAGPGGIEHNQVLREHFNELRAKQDKGEPLVWRAAVKKQGDTPAIQVSG